MPKAALILVPYITNGSIYLVFCMTMFYSILLLVYPIVAILGYNY